MSQYPYGYGQYPGHNPQQQYPYPQYDPSYAPQPDPNAVQAHYGASQSSYDYNASRIPGLGIVGTPTGVSPYPGLNSGPWTQQSPMMNGPPGSAFPFPAYAPPVTPASQPYTPSYPQTVAPPDPAPAPVSVPVSGPEPDTAYDPENEESAEEGEVSEGEFDDLYEPREPVVQDSLEKQVTQADNTSKASESRDESMVDPQDVNFYETEVEDVSIVPNGAATSAAVRERSGSYSPYLSPREIHHDEPTSDESTRSSSDVLRAVPSQQRNLSATKQQQAQNTSQASISATSPFKSVAEAKKEAQKAILRLLPHGVKYQTYIDEGFDEKVVKTLFTELNLIPSSDSPVLQMSSTQPDKDKIPASKAESPTATTASKGEERKDRIARLLAQKAANPSKPTVPSPSTIKPASSASKSGNRQTTSVSKKSGKSKADMDLILKQKLEALMKKTQQSQAQKATGTKDSIPPSTSGGRSRPQTETPQPLPASTRSQQPSPLPGASVPQASTLSGLLASANHTAQTSNQRKRPVASDFVDYPASNPAKRPFAPSHQESSLVIDISDESDDDVEMDVDSPEDSTSMSAVPSGPSIPRGPSIRDFPPLSNGLPNRQFSSPAPSSHTHTPPHHTNGKPAESEYLRKLKAIAEIKRQIAEKEAKKGAKQGSLGPQTPNGGTGTPPEVRALEMSESRLSEALSSGIVESSDGPSAQLISEAQSIKLPKRSDLASSSQESTRERRLRISSVQLPRIEAGLAEKNAKLKLLRDAEAKLQAEISAAMAEQKRLNEEMSTLDLESKESTPLPSGQDSEVPSAERDVQPGGQPSPTTPSGDQQDEPSVEMSGALSPDTHRDDLPVDVPKVVAASVEPEATQEQPEDQSDSRDTHVDSHSAEVATSVQGELASLPSVEVETEDVDVAMDMGSIDETTEPIAASSGVDDDITHSVADDPEMLRPPETTGRDTADQAHIDTPSFSPASVDPTLSITEDTPQLQVPEALETSGTMPTQISSVDVQANDAALEEHAETADAPREDDDEPTSEVRTSFVPYESPLQYFHAYRFHPNYSKSVPGGLKSLTYSNRIDTKKEVCPYELDGQACPKGDDCEFQHFQKMAAPDDQILLELGQSDEYAGDDKTRFMAGLRQLLTEFRAAKVKDFASIAQGIVDYRRRFLNDSSKVLRLEGVHI